MYFIILFNKMRFLTKTERRKWIFNAEKYQKSSIYFIEKATIN